MSDTLHEMMTESRVIMLGLSPQSFRQFLLDEGYISDLELRLNPAIVCKLMSEDGIWEAYEVVMENAYYVRNEKLEVENL